MNDSGFDTLARSFALSGATRRNLFQILGFGAIGLAGADLHPVVTAPGPTVHSRQRRNQSVTATLIDELAFDLEYDMDQIIDFVTHDIRFEPYSGALRGPLGTVWAGAGNATDKSQLLVALMRASEIAARVIPALSVPDDATALWQAQRANPFSPRIANAILTFSGVDTSTAVGTSADGANRRSAIQNKAQARIVATTSQLAGAMASAGLDISATPAASVPAAWHSVSISSGAEEIAVDVITGDRRAGAPAPPEATPAAPGGIDDDQFHMVTIRIIAEVISGSSTTMTTLLETPLRSQDMVGQSIALVHLDGNDMNAIGIDLGDVLGGTVAYTPLLIAGPDFYYGTEPMVFGGQGGLTSVFDTDSSNGSDGEPVAEYLEVEIRSPGFEPTTVTRTLFDRIADQRGGDAYDFSNLEAVEIVDLGSDFKRYLPVASLVAFAILPGPLPPGYSLIPDQSQTPALRFANAAKGVQSVRQSLGAASTTSAASGYINQPNVVAYTYAPSASSGSTLDMVRISADVIHGRTTGLSADDAVPYGLLAGVTTQVAERTALDPEIFALSIRAVRHSRNPAAIRSRSEPFSMPPLPAISICSSSNRPAILRNSRLIFPPGAPPFSRRISLPTRSSSCLRPACLSARTARLAGGSSTR